MYALIVAGAMLVFSVVLVLTNKKEIIDEERLLKSSWRFGGQAKQIY